MKNILQRLVLVLSLAVLAYVSSGCRNTAHGVGEDLEDAGEKIQRKTR